jgi:poly(beta-D-mannuronate) lyase
MLKRLLLPILIIIGMKAAYSKNIIVRNPAELEKAVSAAVPGDHVIIANGNYTDWSCKLSGRGTAEAPIIIDAETPGSVVFSGTVSKTVLTITGEHIEVANLVFRKCGLEKPDGSAAMLIEFKGTQKCRLRSCLFEQNEVSAQFMPLVVISGIADGNRVDHCKFIANINNQELQVKITAKAVPLNTLIDNNEFRDKPRVTWPVFNGGECIQIGQDPVTLGTRSAMVIVRENRFFHCDGEPEVISNKSSGNQYIKNILENCDGELVMRGGHDCLIDSNTILGGTGGIRVNGSKHTITHNIIRNTPIGIRLMYGMAKGKSEIGFYIAATDCTISNNQISQAKTGILIGDSKNVDLTGKFDIIKYPSRTVQDIPPQDNIIKDNHFDSTKIQVKDNTNQ